MEYSAALREFQDYVDDVVRARHQSFQAALGRCIALLEGGTLLGELTARCLPHVNFDEWYGSALNTVGGFVGSGTLDWPSEKNERVALQLELLRRMVASRIDVLDFCHKFLYSSSYHDENIAGFVDQIFKPFARDYLRLVHADAVAREKPHKSEPSDAPGQAQVAIIDASRLAELRTIRSASFDLARLVRLCEELNICYRQECYHAVAMITRAILDHVPPIFGLRAFTEVVSNYAGAKSFKAAMGHLDGSARKIGDGNLHVPIRAREILPNATQVNFGPELDVLLAEVVRVLK